MQQLKIQLIPHGKTPSNTSANIWFLLKENKYFEINNFTETNANDSTKEEEHFIVIDFEMKNFQEVHYVINSLQGLGFIESNKSYD